MIAFRIIPSLLYKNSSLIKGKQFANDRIIGNATQSSQVYAKRKVDEIIFIDVSGSRQPDLQQIRKLSDWHFSPITVGGCITTMEDISGCFINGADKVLIGAACFENPCLIESATNKYGAQAICASLDIYQNAVYVRSGKMKIHGSVIDCARRLQSMGVGEIIINDIEREGTLDGLNLNYLDSIRDYINVPVLINGGCESIDDMEQAYHHGASGVIAGALYAFTDFTPRQAAVLLHDRNIVVRL